MVQIKIDQAPLPPGVAGVAREDLALGSPATLTAVGGPYLRYQWRIISKPLDLATQLFSAAVLSIPDASVTLLQPVDVIGTYLVEVSVDSGAGLGARATDVARITFYAGPTLGATPGTFPRRIPATGETVEHNVAGNQEGWAAELRFWLAALQFQAQTLRIRTVSVTIDQSELALLGPGVKTFAKTVTDTPAGWRVMGIAKVGIIEFLDGISDTYELNVGWSVFYTALVNAENLGPGATAHFDSTKNYFPQKLGFTPPMPLVLQVVSVEDLNLTVQGLISVEITFFLSET